MGPDFLREHCSSFSMVLGEATDSGLNCLSPPVLSLADSGARSSFQGARSPAQRDLRYTPTSYYEKDTNGLHESEGNLIHVEYLMDSLVFTQMNK